MFIFHKIIKFKKIYIGLKMNTPINYLTLINLNEQIKEWLLFESTKDNSKKKLLISYGRKNKRCKVHTLTDENTNKLIQKATNFIEKKFLKEKDLISYLKIDFVKNIERKNWLDVYKEIQNQKHNNHYRKGISFDNNFNICFLEQEIYGNSIISSKLYNEPNFIDEKNLNNAIKEKYPNIKNKIYLDKIKTVWIFDTVSVFYDHGEIIHLQSGNSENGVRLIEENTKDHIKKIIDQNALFLHNQILETGQFIYGYFPAFDNKIKSYNTVRHCTSLYALLETFEIRENLEYWPKIHLAIQYSLDNFYKLTDENTAYMIDSTSSNPEIKLGANAAAILMLTKYQEITNNNQYQKYAEKLANGILTMIDEKGETIHILEYPTLIIKEKFRIIYYDGETALALLRLYQINKNEILLNTVKLMFEKFISKSYEKYHDHWLSYCTNELTKICPDEKYYKFGIRNYLDHMKFIKNRKTAYATLLEMMMSAYKMVARLNKQEYQDLFNLSKFEDLKSLITLRVEFQRTGFFYPEVAMYMKKPDQVLNSFYVRHDRFRTRIDDQEHNLSGYIAYYLHFEG